MSEFCRLGEKSVNSIKILGFIFSLKEVSKLNFCWLSHQVFKVNIELISWMN